MKTLHAYAIALLLAFLILFYGSAAGAEFYVATHGSDAASGTSGNPLATIQQGINSAANGDTVWVKPGTYSGTGNRAITLNGKQISVRSESGPISTIIDCGRQQAFIAQNGERKTTYIGGFTITNGYVANARDWTGLGIIHMEDTSLTVENCIFHANEATIFDPLTPSLFIVSPLSRA